MIKAAYPMGGKARHIEEESTYPPVFIVGHPRSGTTLLASIFDRHPQMSIPPETGLLTPRVRRPMLKAIRDGAPPTCGPAAQLFEDLKLDSTEFWTPTPPPDLRSLTAAILEAYRLKLGADRVGEKTPLHLRHAETLMRWFPDSKIICAVRDGRDAVTSAMKLPHHHQSTLWHIQNWNRDARTALRLSSSRPEAFRCVKFEELVSSPEPLVRQLCDFIGLTYHTRQLDHKIESGAKLPGETWKAKIAEPIDAGRAYAWKRTASDEKAAEWTFLMRRQLRRFGYPESDLGARLTWRRRASLRLACLAARASRPVRGFAHRLRTARPEPAPRPSDTRSMG